MATQTSKAFARPSLSAPSNIQCRMQEMAKAKKRQMIYSEGYSYYGRTVVDGAQKYYQVDVSPANSNRIAYSQRF